MKIKNIVLAHNVCVALGDCDNVSPKLAYQIAKFIYATQSDVDFYNTELNKLMSKYGVRMDGDNALKIDDDASMEAFVKDLNELQAVEVSDPGIRLSLADMTRDIKLTPRQMYQLLDFVQDDDTAHEASQTTNG